MAGVADFIAHFAVAKANQVGAALAGVMVRFDPETASEVDIAKLKAAYQNIGLNVSEQVDREEKSHALVTSLEKRLSNAKQAAGMIDASLTKAKAENNTDQVAVLSTQLTTVMAQIVDIAGETCDGTQSGQLFDAIQTHHLDESDLHELEQMHAGAVQLATTAERRLTEAKAGMERAAREEERAHDRERRAEEMAGLRKTLGGDSIALQIMEQKRADTTKRSRAATINAAALSKVSEKTADADDIVSKTLKGAAVEEDAQARFQRMMGHKAA